MNAPGKHAAAAVTAGREPILTRAAVLTVLSVLCALLVQLGAGSVSAWLDGHSELIAGAVLAVAPLVTAALARRHTTALADPRDASGAELVPAGSDAATLDVTAALERADAIHPAGVDE